MTTTSRGSCRSSRRASPTAASRPPTRSWRRGRSWPSVRARRRGSAPMDAFSSNEIAALYTDLVLNGLATGRPRGSLTRSTPNRPVAPRRRVLPGFVVRTFARSGGRRRGGQMTGGKTRHVVIAAATLLVGIGGAGQASPADRRRQRLYQRQNGGQHARHRQELRPRHDGPQPDVRDDRRNHHPGDVRHAADVPEQRRHRADAGARRELGGQRGRNRVHVHAARRRRLLRRHTRRGSRRGLLAQPGARTEEQRRLPDGRRHRRSGRRVDCPAHHRGAQPGAAADPADPDAGHRQQRRRHRERGHRSARRRRRRHGRGVPQLDVGGIRSVHPGELQHHRRDGGRRQPGVRRTAASGVRPHRRPQQRRDHAGDRRAERQRRHRHGPRQ